MSAMIMSEVRPRYTMGVAHDVYDYDYDGMTERRKAIWARLSERLRKNGMGKIGLEMGQDYRRLGTPWLGLHRMCLIPPILMMPTRNQ
jgi:hypothetical protein